MAEPGQHVKDNSHSDTGIKWQRESAVLPSVQKMIESSVEACKVQNAGIV